jgi:Arc/MetJ-type ribon-helix-helix transcriptional regulator
VTADGPWYDAVSPEVRMKTYQITLPDDVAAFVDRVLAEKKWDDVDHLIMYALGSVESELAADADVNIDELRKLVRVGIDQADRGELVDGEITMKRLREKLEAARKQPT